MIDIKKHYYNMGNEDINMMLFGDLHYSDKFNDKKIDLIYNKLKNSEYIFIVGDLLDSTDVVNNIDKRDKLIKFLEKVSKKSKVFITLGNHDLAIRNKHKKAKDDNNEFWLEVSKIDGIYLSRYNNYYEDDKIIVYLLEQDYDYYYKNKHESRELLLDRIKEDKILFNSIDSNKIKIVLCHSPINISNKDVSNELENFNFIFCGHMHNGMMPYYLDKIIKGNRGLMSPDNRLFADNTRGVKDINNTHLIISGGITKLSKTTGIFRYFNFVYPMSIDNIVIKIGKIKKKVDIL